ncbi:hypothetical protein ASPVEDRAFT_46044 [Aspergillus versicolor CBS 583.65]|uniref:Uncharacterized protein n=1 Tax=Aspergillus versicolor CBS 583.65 TaxID=1036611 RepID=A0A1L9PYS2_ASPVE|nr:uncharacterized protein ASPVEDRAFT_46044 [Aspergillus versicolor CBS 583.65]OJJ06689.1 hypothetical protein ASPVEDRAFT_46044 [Aspergillus versicolor CBS 583.65]
MSVSFDKPDLRQAGTAAKRVYDKKAKWVHGGRTSRPGVITLDGVLPITRPAKQESTSWNKRQRERDAQRGSTTRKIDFHNDVREALDDATSDSSAVEDRGDPVVATTVAEVCHGDGVADPYEVSGQTLFNDMIDKAVEKFERKETEKLVKEYEFITRESEIATGYLADEDEFELVDHVKL